jgi:hypothetical protein
MRSKKHFFWNGTCGLFLSLVVILYTSADVFADVYKNKKIKWVKSKTGLKSLMTLSKDTGKMESELKEETKSYESVKKAMDEGLLEKGMASSEVSSKYGEPVLVISDQDGKLTRWVYKPSQATYFSGPKVYLFFDPDDGLQKWETVGG